MIEEVLSAVEIGCWYFNFVLENKMNDNERLNKFRMIGIKYPDPKPKKRFKISVPFGLGDVAIGVGIFLVSVFVLGLAA